MLVAAPMPVPPALQEAPLGLTSVSPTSLLSPSHTAIAVRHSQLNVLAGRASSVTGALRDSRHQGLSRRVVVLQALGTPWLGHASPAPARAPADASV